MLPQDYADAAAAAAATAAAAADNILIYCCPHHRHRIIITTVSRLLLLLPPGCCCCRCGCCCCCRLSSRWISQITSRSADCMSAITGCMRATFFLRITRHLLDQPPIHAAIGLTRRHHLRNHGLTTRAFCTITAHCGTSFNCKWRN